MKRSVGLALLLCGLVAGLFAAAASAATLVTVTAITITRPVFPDGEYIDVKGVGTVRVVAFDAGDAGTTLTLQGTLHEFPNSPNCGSSPIVKGQCSSSGPITGVGTTRHCLTPANGWYVRRCAHTWRFTATGSSVDDNQTAQSGCAMPGCGCI